LLRRLAGYVLTVVSFVVTKYCAYSRQCHEFMSKCL